MKTYTNVFPSFIEDDQTSRPQYSVLAQELDKLVANQLGQNFVEKYSNHGGWWFVEGSTEEKEFDQIFLGWKGNHAFDRYQFNTASKKQLDASKKYIVNTNVASDPFAYIVEISGSVFFKRKNKAKLKDLGGYLTGVSEYFYDFDKYRRPWKEYTGCILVTEQFKALAEEKAFTGISFNPVYELECKGLGERSDLDAASLEECICPNVYQMVVTSETKKPKILNYGEKAVRKIIERDGEPVMYLNEPVMFGAKMGLPTDGFANTDFQIARKIQLPGGEIYTEGDIERDFFLQLIMSGRAISCILDASLKVINPYLPSKPKADFFEVPTC